MVFRHPNADGDGWYALDSYVRRDSPNVNATLDAAVVVVKDQGGNNTSAEPTGFTLVWSDAGSGALTTYDAASSNLLLVPLSDYEQGEYLDQTVLTVYRTLKLGDTLTASARIPFTLIPAAKEATANTNRNVT